mgnify:CR=1 FL=1
MNKLQKRLGAWALILLFFGIVAAYYVLLRGNTASSDGEYFYIKSNAAYNDVRQGLINEGLVKDIKTFDLVSKQMNLPNTYKAGRYKIEEGLSNMALVRKIRSGQWEKVVIKIKPEMSRDEVIEHLAFNLEAEAEDIRNELSEEWAATSGFTDENVWNIFLPDFYHFNWASSSQKIIARFSDEYNRFWTSAKKAKAKELELSTKQACILASIVDGEAIHVKEMPIIAGLYLNRLKKGIALQADPTILYLVGREGRQRVLYRDLKQEDPYNTYLNTGLPPGPIFMPDKRAINAVLSPAKHNYIFMCAKPDGSYYHNFAVTKAQHDRNAAAYRRSLNQRGIMR